MTGSTPTAPLNVLLAHALLDLTRASEREGAEEVVLWSNLLRVLDDDGIEVRALPTRVRLSRRAVKTNVDALVRHDWATRQDGVVRLTNPAREARRAWADAIARAEAAWAIASAGPELRTALQGFVGRLPLEHAHYPCGYGASDPRVTGGPGADWTPVPRDPTVDTVGSISLLALVSQALIGFAAAYETESAARGASFPLQVGVHLAATFSGQAYDERTGDETDDAVPLADLPTALMVTGNGRSGLERHGAVTVDRFRRVRLTPLGARVRDDYNPIVETVEASMPGTADLRAALEALTLDSHADHPDVRAVGSYAGFSEVSARA